MSLIIWIFLLFFLEFYIPDWQGTDKNDIFFFLSFSPCPVPFRMKRSHKILFSFLNFFCYFSKIPIPGRVGMDQNENFFFSHILSLSCAVLAWKGAIMMFFNFLNFFCYFFGIPYSGLGWNGLEREYFFSLILSLSRPVLVWKETTMTFFIFFIFFAIFLEFPLSGPVGMVQDENFLFSHSQPLPSHFGLRISCIDVF